MSAAAEAAIPGHIHDWVGHNRAIVDQWTTSPEYRRQMLADIEGGEYRKYGLSDENVSWIRERLGNVAADEIAGGYGSGIAAY